MLFLYTVAEGVNTAWFNPGCIRSSTLALGQRGSSFGEGTDRTCYIHDHRPIGRPAYFWSLCGVFSMPWCWTTMSCSVSSRPSRDGSVLGRRCPNLCGMALYLGNIVPTFAGQHCTRSAPFRSSRDDAVLGRCRSDFRGIAPYLVDVILIFAGRRYIWVV